jgi:hypothetical protein
MLSVGSFENFSGVFADATSETGVAGIALSVQSGHLLSAIVYSTIGLTLLGMSIWLADAQV